MALGLLKFYRLPLNTVFAVDFHTTLYSYPHAIMAPLIQTQHNHFETVTFCIRMTFLLSCDFPTHLFFSFFLVSKLESNMSLLTFTCRPILHTISASELLCCYYLVLAFTFNVYRCWPRNNNSSKNSLSFRRCKVKKKSCHWWYKLSKSKPNKQTFPSFS